MDDAQAARVRRTVTVYRALGVAITTVGVLALVELFTVSGSIGFGAMAAELGLAIPRGIGRLSLLLVAAFGPPAGFLFFGLANRTAESAGVDLGDRP